MNIDPEKKAIFGWKLSFQPPSARAYVNLMEGTSFTICINFLPASSVSMLGIGLWIDPEIFCPR